MQQKNKMVLLKRKFKKRQIVSLYLHLFVFSFMSNVRFQLTPIRCRVGSVITTCLLIPKVTWKLIESLVLMSEHAQYNNVTLLFVVSTQQQQGAPFSWQENKFCPPASTSHVPVLPRNEAFGIALRSFMTPCWNPSFPPGLAYPQGDPYCLILGLMNADFEWVGGLISFPKHPVTAV